MTSESADRYESPVKPGPTHWDAPPRMRGPRATELRDPSFSDLTGLKTGRVVVVGILADNTARYQRWVVRCVCGHYETRRAKALREGGQPDSG